MNEQKIGEFVSRVVSDLNATANCALVFIGDKLGFYKAMMNNKDCTVTSQELATLTNTNERFVRDWLAEQVCSGYITYDPSTLTFTLPIEHAIVLADESSPAYMSGAFQLVLSALKSEAKVTNAFRTGQGFSWLEYDPGVFEGQSRFTATTYKANLVNNWIPALDGVEERIKGGAKVADVGCGYGISTLIMAKAYPSSTFIGFDSLAPSIEYARSKAKEEGFTQDRVKFELASSTQFPGNNYDFITFFDCIHDIGDPYSIARYAKNAFKSDGTLMLVEMASNDKLEDNMTRRMCLWPSPPCIQYQYRYSAIRTIIPTILRMTLTIIPVNELRLT
jgi:2-polyprenyl-3-methyl-5-hydroxy-6-metoxy-1,4-benzoquinol methylase